MDSKDESYQKIVVMERRGAWAEKVADGVKEFVREMNKARKRMEQSRRLYVLRAETPDQQEDNDDFGDHLIYMTEFLKNANELVQKLQSWVESRAKAERIDLNE